MIFDVTVIIDLCLIALLSDPPKVDVLLMEGTVIGERQEESFSTEAYIQEQLIELCKETKGAIFVSVPSQNIDRVVSLSKAALQTGRKFVIDLYSAELFDRLKAFSPDIPQLHMLSPYSIMVALDSTRESVQEWFEMGDEKASPVEKQTE